jgi:hypothetical protein
MVDLQFLLKSLQTKGDFQMAKSGAFPRGHKTSGHGSGIKKVPAPNKGGGGGGVNMPKPVR